MELCSIAATSAETLDQWQGPAGHSLFGSRLPAQGSMRIPNANYVIRPITFSHQGERLKKFCGIKEKVRGQ